MKKVYLYILLMACTMIFASCQKDFDGVFTAEIQDYANGGGKVYIDGERFACWHNGDMVKINGNPFSVNINGDKATITTNFASEPTEYRAVFPSAYDNGNNFIKLPQTQIYEEDADGVQKVNAPMVAYTTGSEMRFFNAASLLKLTVVGGDSEISVGKIEVGNVNPTSKINLWGEVVYSQCNNEAPRVNNVKNGNTGGKSITFTIPKGKGAIAKNGKRTFYIVIPKVGGNGNNVKLSIKTTYTKGGVEDNKVLTMKESRAIPINMILNLTVNLTDGTMVDWSGQGIEGDPYLIKSAEDLLLLASRCNDNNNYRGVYFEQRGEIVLGENYSGITGFAGNYNGGGYNIKIGADVVNPNGGIFNTLGNGARISNINLQVNISGGTLTAGGIVDEVNSNVVDVEIYNCRVGGSITGKKVGGMIGSVSGGVNIKKCVNRAHVIGAGDAPFVGGMIGEVKGGRQSIVNSANHGNISSYAGNGGGFVGYVSSSIEISNGYADCIMSGTNEGNGGIIGNLKTYVYCNINNVYVGGEKSDNGKWIVGIGNATCSNVYSPSAANNGCTAIQYAENWNVTIGDNTKTLVEWLNDNNNDLYEAWKPSVAGNNNSQPKLNFEP